MCVALKYKYLTKHIGATGHLYWKVVLFFSSWPTVVYFTMEVYASLVKLLLKLNGGLSKLRLSSLVKQVNIWLCKYVKNIAGHTAAHSIVSLPNPKQWLMIHIADLVMMITWSILMKVVHWCPKLLHPYICCFVSFHFVFFTQFGFKQNCFQSLKFWVTQIGFEYNCFQSLKFWVKNCCW